MFARARREALAQYRFEWLAWGLVAPHAKDPGHPPRVPKILEMKPDAS